MSCPSDAEFEQFLADTLSAPAGGQIAEHLAGCAPCCQRLETLSSGSRLRAVRQNETGPATVGQSETGGGDEVTRADSDDWRAELYRLAVRDESSAAPGPEPAARLFRLLTAGPDDEVAGMPLGRFTIRRWLGAGGYGVVFLAEDELLHRQVALKLPRAEALARREVRRRFLREAEAAAQLHHPNVVPVHEAGEADGVCYIASGYCPGPTLSTWLANQREPVPVETAVEIVRQLAKALQHAHDHQVLHRDLKPSNILLEPAVGGSAAPTPKVTDFGLAKLLDAGVSMSGSHEMLGTPRYMAPEQAAGSRLGVGPPTDIFGLGAILYELLTGRAPFVGDDQAQTLHRLLYESVVPARRRRGDVPRDLDAICLKCLEKKSKDRYQSAQALADDLHRFQNRQATRARPIGPLERLRRWTVHQPALAALLGLVATCFLTLLGIFIAYNRSLESFNAEMRAALAETHRAQRMMAGQRTRLRHLLYVSKIELAHQAIGENDMLQASALLREIHAETPDLAGGFVWRYLWSRVAAQGVVIDQCDDDIYTLQHLPSGDRFAACGAESVLRVYDASSFEPLLEVPTGQGEINDVAFSPDQRWIATAGDDGTVRLWNAETGEPGRTISAHENLVFGVVFTPDGSTLISCAREPVIRLWDVDSGAARGTLRGHVEGVEAIALAPGGTELASTSSDHTVRIWDLESQTLRRTLQGHQKRVVAVQYSADGEHLLTGSIDHTIRLWRLDDGRCVQVEQHLDPITSVAIHGRTGQLLAMDRAGSVHLWPRRLGEAEEGPDSEPVHSWKAHQGRGWEVAGPRHHVGTFTAGADGKILYWRKPPELPKAFQVEPGRELEDTCFDPGSPQLHWVDGDGRVRSWDPERGCEQTLVEANDSSDRRPTALTMLPHGVSVRGFSDGTIQGIGLPDRKQRFEWKLPSPRNGAPEVKHLCASDDGRRVAAFSFSHDVTAVYDVQRRALLGTFDAFSHAMTLSGDGSRLAMSDADDVVVWDVDQQQLLHRLQGHTSSVVTLQFSPDRRWLASGSKDRHIRLWDLESQRQAVTLSGHRDEITAVAFSPAGQALVSGDRRGELKFWFLPEAAELVSISLQAPIRRLMFSREGDRLAVQTDHEIRVFDAAPPAASP